MSVFPTSVKLPWIQHVNRCTYDWCHRYNGLVYQSANAVSVSIDGVAGGKVTARDRAASFASEGDGIAVPISL